MVAKYEFAVVGSKVKTTRWLDWEHIVALIEPLTKREIGELTNGMRTNINNNSRFDFALGERIEIDFDGGDMFALYNESGESGISYDGFEGDWQLCFWMPVELRGLNDTAVEQILEELWIRLQPVAPEFAVWGEEMSSQDQVTSAVRGELLPSESIYMGDVLIVSDDMPERKFWMPPQSNRKIQNGELYRFSYFFLDQLPLREPYLKSIDFEP